MQERAAKPFWSTLEALDRRPLCHQSWNCLCLYPIVSNLIGSMKSWIFSFHEDGAIDWSAGKRLWHFISQGEGQHSFTHCLGFNLHLWDRKWHGIIVLHLWDRKWHGIIVASTSHWFHSASWPWHSVVGCDGSSAQEVLDCLCKDQQLSSWRPSITKTNIYLDDSKACSSLFIVKGSKTDQFRFNQSSTASMHNNHPECARDVALKKLKDHKALEQHCENTYKNLTSNVALGISVHLDSNVVLTPCLFSWCLSQFQDSKLMCRFIWWQQNEQLCPLFILEKGINIFTIGLSSSKLRSELMLPDECPYLQAITARFKAETSRKRTREGQEYDLTKLILCCIGHCNTVCMRMLDDWWA